MTTDLTTERLISTPATTDVPNVSQGSSSNLRLNQQRRRVPKNGEPDHAQGGSRNSQWRSRNQNQNRTPASESVGTLDSGEPSRQPRRPRPQNARGPASTIDGEVPESGVPSAGGQRQRNPRRRNRPGTSPPSTDEPHRQNDGASRRAKFGASLTQPDDSTPSPSSASHKPKPKSRHIPEGDDLTSALIRGLSASPFTDCLICFSAIRPEHGIWSCSPSLPIVLSTNDTEGLRQYCWSSFHLKCIRSWAEKSVKEVADAWRARGEPERKGDWRCPGCQGKREVVPNGYWCFCNSTPEPKPLRLSTPHSCGTSCSRVRETGCGHPCPLKCHPGPCPPCQVTTRLPCYCPRKKVLTFRCGVDTQDALAKGKGKTPGIHRDLSCGETCGRKLNCGVHSCSRVCHDGECSACEEREVGRCWCGKEEKDVVCGSGEKVPCFVEGEEPWVGSFACEKNCERTFDCGIHKCSKACHVPSSQPAPCPRSPTKITHCPCGKTTIAPPSSSSQSKYTYTFPPRNACTDPIPTCTQTCGKENAGCGHRCKAPCHEGPCPSCKEDVVRPCRCGRTTKNLTCYTLYQPNTDEAQTEILCDKPCTAYRACGKHPCRRICCPLASLASLGQGKKGKKKATAIESETQLGEEPGGLHECDVVCGKLLSCGNHRCEMRDHKGACGPCLRSSFEELICSCGLTVYEPPIQCGTTIQCPHPCPRPPPSCGHPHTQHTCHPDTTLCPPCAFLATKVCACGKKMVGNVRCSLERDKVSCGQVCGKLAKCGFHSCERVCHGDKEGAGCGDCLAICGKARRSCLPELHPCTLPCHAPSACPETAPCPATITLSCPCGRIKQNVFCGRTSTSTSTNADGTSSSSRIPSTHPATPRCTTECQIAKRNAKLAEALGINLEARAAGGGLNAGGSVVYSDELLGFAHANGKFLSVVEKAFSDFVKSEKKTQVLPHMPPEKRKIVTDLASIYRMDTQMVDQEPHRSVQLLRRIDTRIPSPLLSQATSSSSSTTPSTNNLGKLADLRMLRTNAVISTSSGSSSDPPWRSTTPTNTKASTSTATKPIASRGWGNVPVAAVVQRPASSNSSPNPGTSSSARVPVSQPHLLNAGAGKSRTGSPLPSVGRPVVAPSAATEPVTENWEDDV